MGLRRNIVANYVGAGWNALMNVAFVSAYIHHLGPAGYGLIGVFTLLLGLMALLDLGMAPTVSRELARLGALEPKGAAARMLLRGAELVATVLGIVVAIVIVVASPWLASHWLDTRGLRQDDVTFALRVMGLLVGLRILENVYRSALIGLQRQVVLNAILAVSGTLRNGGAFVVVAWIAPDVRAFFLWQLATGAATVVAFGVAVYLGLSENVRPQRFSFAPLRATWRFAAGTMVVASLSIVLGNLDKILLTRLLPLDAFGYYALAVVVAQAPLGLITPVAQAFYPRFTQLHASHDERLAVLYHTASQGVSVLIGTATAFLVLLGRPVLQLWLHDPVTVDRVVGLVAVLATGSMLNGIMTLPYFLQLAAGWTRLTIRVNLVAVCLVVPALALLVPVYGGMAAAWIWLCLNAGYVLVAVPLMHRRLLRGELGHWYLNDVLPPVLAATVVGAGWRWMSLPVPAGIGGWAMLTFEGCVMLAAASIASPAVRQRLGQWRTLGTP
nr:oligosaccharide flippase family protein [Luteibacter rhizovicinus]